MEHRHVLSSKELFTSYYPRLCHFAWQFLRDDQRVQDVVQDAFLAFWDKKHALADNPVAIKNYLYTSVKNACFNIKRHNKTVERYQSMHPFEEAEEPSVLDELFRSEVMAEIYEIMKKMPDSCREVFRLGYLEGYSAGEIADLLCVSVSTVKTQKHRALKLIKSNLNPEFFAIFSIFYQNL